jgi:hypothetical protein
MKRTIALLVMVGMLSLGMMGYVDSNTTSSPTYNVQASIQAGTPDAAFELYKAPDGGNIVWTKITSGIMDFNTFTTTTVKANTTQWVSVDHYAVVAWCRSMGRQYYVKSAGAGTFALTADPTKTLPAGSFACIPTYAGADLWDASDPNSKQDDDNIPPGTKSPMFKAITGSLTTATNVYVSESAASNRIIQVRYGFPPYASGGADPYTGYQYIPTNQAPGPYTGVQVKVTITQ